MYTLTCAHPHICTHTHTTLTMTHPHTHAHTLSCTHTYTRAHTLIRRNTHVRTRSHAQRHRHIHDRTYTHTCTLLPRCAHAHLDTYSSEHGVYSQTSEFTVWSQRDLVSHAPWARVTNLSQEDSCSSELIGFRQATCVVQVVSPLLQNSWRTRSNSWKSWTEPGGRGPLSAQ